MIQDMFKNLTGKGVFLHHMRYLSWNQTNSGATFIVQSAASLISSTGARSRADLDR